MESDIIKLNVGGMRFETLRSTLLKIEGTYFRGLLDCDIPPSGEYFIDRDGRKFCAILNYLRGNRNEYIDPVEASFYCLPLASSQYHQEVLKDVALAHEYLEKYHDSILMDVLEAYKNQMIEGDLKKGVTLYLFSKCSHLTWDIVRSWVLEGKPPINYSCPNPFDDNNNNLSIQNLKDYEKGLLISIVHGGRFGTFMRVFQEFFLSQGLMSSIYQYSGGGIGYAFAFSWSKV